MLRSFRVANHKSIRAAQELVLLPAYDKSRPVTPVAAIYGANASGKSNLLDALRWMRDAVITSFASWMPGGGVPRLPFKLDPAAAGERSEFAVDLIIDGVRHFYGFVVDDEAVREEWLHTFPKNRRRILFERKGPKWTFGSGARSQFEAARELTRANSLFLSVAARSNILDSQPLFRWFANGLTYPQPGIAVGADVRQVFADDSPLRQTVLDLLRAADLGITDVRLANPFDPDGGGQDGGRAHQASGGSPGIDADSLTNLIWTTLADAKSGQIVFYHGNQPVPLTIFEESAGTRTWLNLTLVIATALVEPKVLLFDEADTMLHPHLSRHLVNLFRNPNTNPLGSQLIFTSHDATMLDEDTLSRDEIWFVEKDPSVQSTKLYSLAEFRPRRHENTERRYLAGSYGAVPLLSEFATGRALKRGTDPNVA